MTAGSISVPTIVPLRAPVLGQHKSYIDSNTRIELRCDAEVPTKIFYTLNGARPEPFQTIGNLEAKATFLFKDPFILPPGKRTIRAMALADDGRESFIVTKVFEVEPLGGRERGEGERYVAPSTKNRDPTGGLGFIYEIPAADEAKREVQKFANDMVPAREAWNELKRNKQGDYHSNGGDYRSNGSSYHSNGGYDSLLTNGHATTMPTGSDSLKCTYCFAARPVDPAARFCNECGNALPPLPFKHKSPDLGQMNVCSCCRTLVPSNAARCLVCETPLHSSNPHSPHHSSPTRRPQASSQQGLADRLLCTLCGTANPTDLRTCLTCGASLVRNAKGFSNGDVHVNGVSSVLGGGSGSRGLTGGGAWSKGDSCQRCPCSKCGRINNVDARFCDWCGAKPIGQCATPLVCHKCHATNDHYAHSCNSCGVILAPPTIDYLSGVSFILPHQNGDRHRTGPADQLASPANRMTPKHDAFTQTVGPSMTLALKNREQEFNHSEEKETKPLLTSVSPGRGYWRKQMDHICGHLKAHAANSADFRALIGDLRIGKLLTASIDEDGYELSVVANFKLRSSEDDSYIQRSASSAADRSLRVGSAHGRGSRAGAAERGVGLRRGSFNSMGSVDSLDSAGRASSRQSNGSTSGHPRSVKRRPKSAPKKRVVRTVKGNGDEKQEVTEINKKLLKEVGKKGEGQPTEIREMIEEGADANCTNKDGVPVLLVAVRNKHAEAVQTLVQEGADVNRKGPDKENTALHEAIALGPSGLPVIDALLGCGANPNKRNEKGETPFDLAVKSGYESIAQKLATFLGQSAINKMTKPKSVGLDL